MSELIKREDVQREIQASFDGGAFRWQDGQDLMDRINALPTIDAVPVVRCGECKWYGIYYAKKDGTPDKRYRPSVCLRGKYAKRRDQDWFCADGERKVLE